MDNRLGARFDGKGTNFGVFSANAEKIELCLFDENGKEQKIPMTKDNESNIWNAYLPNIKPGQKYGFRAHGQYNPDEGQFFNPNKLLVDPYAFQIDKSFEWDDSLRTHAVGNIYAPDDRDSSAFVPKSVVVDMKKLMSSPSTPSPKIPTSETIIYEAHVKGLTALNPDVPPEDRGTFKGMANPKVIEHFKNLGVNAVELLPIQAASVDQYLGKKGLTNYWGYNPVTYFATDPKYGDLADLKNMVNAYHKAGIKIIMDVVDNHTGEGSSTDPTLSMRGLDNSSYYSIHPDNKAWYDDASGCGNSLDLNKPETYKIIEGYKEMFVDLGIDGYRHDLATIPARNNEGEFDINSKFVRMPVDNPKFKDTMFIAEPWAATGGARGKNLYQPDGFPRFSDKSWRAWDDGKKHTFRSFTCGRGDLAGRIAYYMARRNTEDKSVSFVACHDGFTLRDYYQYSDKQNQNNIWNNEDGDSSKGAGFGDNKPHLARSIANSMSLIMLSGGVPMLSMGDEFGRSQKGNNNPYHHDDEVSWMKWENNEPDFRHLPKFISTLTELRKKHPALSADTSFSGNIVNDQGDKDITWRRPDGSEMNGADWNSNVLSFQVSGDRLKNGQKDDDFMVMMNMSDKPIDWKLPVSRDGKPWEVVCATSDLTVSNKGCKVDNNQYLVGGCETVILRMPKTDGRQNNMSYSKMHSGKSY